MRIGAQWFARAGVIRPASSDDSVPRGVVDHIRDLAHPGIDTTRVHPDIVRFFEDTGSLELRIRSHWRFPVSLVWRMARPLMHWLGQLVLPRREARVLTRVLPLATERDGRSDARAVVRTYADHGEVFQAVAYATTERRGRRFMNAAFPLPGGHLTGILRLDAMERDADGWLAVALESARRERSDPTGVWLVVAGLGVPLPLSERLELWSASSPSAPCEVAADDWPGTSIVGRHVQRLCGVRVVTHLYWFRPR